MSWDIFKKAKKVQNKNLMEAIVAICMLVGMADGSVGDAEMSKIDKLLTSNENLGAFKPSDIRQTMTRYKNVLEADFGVGQKKMIDEIAEISGNPDHCEEVFLNAMAVAKADGDIDEKERAVLAKVGGVLGTNLKEYELA